MSKSPKNKSFRHEHHYFRPVHSRDHLGVGNGSKKVQWCYPYPEHIECHAQVVKELKEKDEHDKIQAREVVKRPFKSGQSDDVIDVEKFDKVSEMYGVERTLLSCFVTYCNFTVYFLN